MAQRTSCLKNIAYELGLSINTVSRALRDCDDISKSTKALVRQKAFEMGYIQSTVARYIKRDEKKLVAIVINSLSNLFFSIISHKLSCIALMEQYDFTIISTFKDYIDEDIIKQCLSQRVDAIISTLIMDKKAIDACKLNNIPVSLVGNHNPNDDYCDSVSSDYATGANIAANYIVKYHNITRIVFVDNPLSLNSRGRYDLFREVLQSIDSSIELKVMTIDEICENFVQLINDNYYGYFCFNDEIAYKLLKKLNEMIPNVRTIYPKFHLVGYDGLCCRIEGLIDITTINCDFDTMCTTGFGFVKDRLENNYEGKNREVTIPVQFHQRNIK